MLFFVSGLGEMEEKATHCLGRITSHACTVLMMSKFILLGTHNINSSEIIGLKIE